MKYHEMEIEHLFYYVGVRHHCHTPQYYLVQSTIQTPTTNNTNTQNKTKQNTFIYNVHARYKQHCAAEL